MPELPLPQINDPFTETGNIVEVHELGMGETTPYIIDADGIEWDLPMWYFEWMIMVQAHGITFPCEIEFGRLKTRPYAEFII